MRKEIIVCKELKKWFKRFGVKCWLNEGNKKFTTKKSQKKPDLIIYSVQSDQFIAIEVKKGNVSREIFDSSKILNYWKDYEKNKIEYYINKNKIKISPFAVATMGSMFGKIFLEEDGEPKDSHKNPNEWQKVQIKYNLEPRWEYPATHKFLRHIWADWRKIREKKEQAGVGVILSNVLNHSYVEPLAIDSPILFDMEWERRREKHQWVVRQKRL